MDGSGKSYPIIPYDLLLDTDFGLYTLLKENYMNDEVFCTGILIADPGSIRYFLLNRKQENPLLTIARNPNKQYWDLMYKQFFDKELEAILERSPVTALWNVILMAYDDPAIKFSVWCPNDTVANFLKSNAPNLFKKTNIIVTDTFHDAITEHDEPIYLKSVIDAVKIFDVINGKAIYLSNHEFNYNINEVTKRKGLNEDAMVILEGRVNISMFCIYKDEELNKII